MNDAPISVDAAIASKVAAPQHGPRPLPLFLDILCRETAQDSVLRARALTGLRAYQDAVRPHRPPPAQNMAQAGAARLLHFGAAPAARARHPVVFIPSLINPPDVLDLSKERSLLRWLAAQGHDPWLIDWGTPGANDRDLGLSGHVEDRLLPLLHAAGLSGDRAPVLVGYCLGGTLAIGAAALAEARAVVTIAAPWHFDGIAPEARAQVASLWEQARPLCDRLGCVPMEILQTGFWSLDPARTIAKYAAFGDMPPDSAGAHAFLALEDWANAGPPLTLAAGRDLFEGLYGGDLSGRGAWRVAGRAIDPARLPCPTLGIASSTDHIVPAACAPALVESRTLNLGHVGMVVGSRAPDLLWRPLSEWLFKHKA